jgi:hypothetical protein
MRSDHLSKHVKTHSGNKKGNADKSHEDGEGLSSNSEQMAEDSTPENEEHINNNTE